MKRIFCAIALVAAVATSAQADINVQLNIEYTNPADESAGGTWELLAGSDGAGVAGISVLIDHLYTDNAANDAAFVGGSGFNVFETNTYASGVTEIVVGSDLAAPATDVGTGDGTTGNQADDLFPGNSPAIWANNALLASGTLGATRPSFVLSSGDLDAGANEFSGTAAVLATLGTTSVRGDGLASDTLLRGDVDRNGDVDGDDLNALLAQFNGAMTGQTWDTGDVAGTGSGDVDGDDLNALLANFNVPAAAPPAVSASSAIASVPEPTSIALGAFALALVAGARRRS